MPPKAKTKTTKAKTKPKPKPKAKTPKAKASGTPAFVATKAPGPVKLSAAEAKVFAACHPDHVIRVGEALVGYERDSEDNDWQSKAIVHRAGRTKSIDADNGFQAFVVAPSGKRFLIID